MATMQQVVLNHAPKPSAPQRTIALVLKAAADVLPPAYTDSLRVMLDKNVKTSSMVFPVMSKIVRNAWYHLARGDALPAHVRFPECAMFLFPTMEKNARSLAAIVTLNNTVHVERYNAIITAAVKTIVETNARKM
jgi:hypothetical protein